MGYGTTNNNGNVLNWNATGAQSFIRTYGYDALNRLYTMWDSAANQGCKALGWSYDAWGNRLRQTVNGGSCFPFSNASTAQNRLLGYLYDAAGNLMSDGSHSYTYDAENRIVKVDGGSTATYVYDAEGGRAEKTLGGVWSDYIHDLSGRPVAVAGVNGWATGYVCFNGSLLAQYRIVRRISCIRITWVIRAYSRPPDRQAAFRVPGGTNTWKYYYTGVCPSVSGTTYTISVMVTNQGTAPVRIGGNIVNGPVISPGSTQQVSFNEVGNGVSCVQLGIVTVNTGDPVDIRAYAPAITASGVDLILQANKNFSGWNANQGASITLTTGRAPLVLDNLDYQPFGEQIAGDTGTSHKFTGKERDSESGLDNFGARYFGSSLGRFQTPDPIFMELHRVADPQSLNLYSYVRNNPITLTDESGMLIDLDCSKVSSAQCSQTVTDINDRKDSQFQVSRDDKTGQLNVVGKVDASKLSKSEAELYKASRTRARLARCKSCHTLLPSWAISSQARV